jgi:hypothetical protein
MEAGRSQSDDRLSALEAAVLGLGTTLADLEDRVAGLEGGRVAGRGHPSAEAAGAGAETLTGPHAGRDLLGDLGLIGTSLLALAGAFLLRTLTQTPRLPDTVGVVLGLAYALLWLVLAWRAAARGRRRRAVFHALVWALIAYPLLWEAHSRFAVLAPAGAALALAAVTALGLGLAARQRLRTAAWFALSGAVAAAWGLAAASGRVAPPFLLLLALLATVLAVAGPLGARGLPWVAAAAADLMAVLATAKLLLGQGAEGAGTVLPLLGGLVVVSLGATHLEARRERWRPRPFELAQTGVALTAVYGAAWWIAARDPAAAPAVGAASLALAVAALTVAARLLARRELRRPAFLYHATVGFVLLLGGSGLLLGPAGRALAWSALAVAAAVLAARRASITLAFQAALYAWSAAAASGLLTLLVMTLAAPAGRPWPPLHAPTALAVLAATAAALALPYPWERRPAWGAATAAPRVALLVLLALGSAAVLLAWLAPAVARASGAGVDAGLLATLRTAALGVLAVVLGAVSHRGARREAAVLVYPLLSLGAVKLLVEDLPAGRPGTLFVGLALYGGALIVAPRLLPRRPAAESRPQ